MCAGSVLVPIQLILSADFPSFFEVTNNKRCTKFDPNTRSDNFSIDTSIWARKFNCFWRVFGDFLFFCPKLALFFWGYEKTSSSYHVQSLRRTGAKSRAKRACTVMDGAPRASVRPSLSDAPAKLYAVSELACERGMGRRKAVERKQLHKWCPIAEQIGHHLPSPAFFRVLKGNKSNFLPLIFWREKFRLKNLLIFGSKIHVWDDFETKIGNLNLEDFQVVRWRFNAFLGWKWVIFRKYDFYDISGVHLDKK